MDSELVQKFQNADVSEFPDFYNYKKALEMRLWVLWVGKEKLQIKRLTAEQIAIVIREVKEISVNANSVTNSLNPARGKVHIYHENDGVYFEIMKPGKEHLLSLVKEGSIEVVYFEPGKRYSSKRVLSKNILGSLQGELSVVDPYCGVRTLDILKEVGSTPVKFITKVERLDEKERKRFLSELPDFKSEHPSIEFRNYPGVDIHDRYIISSESLVVLGHSIKDLGSKESFAVVLTSESSRNLVDALRDNFNKRWLQSSTL